MPRIRFHDLRHSFATLSLEQGMDIKTVSHMLGHTDAGFTMNTYMHVTDSMQENVANRWKIYSAVTQQIHKWSIDGHEIFNTKNHKISLRKKE